VNRLKNDITFAVQIISICYSQRSSLGEMSKLRTSSKSVKPHQVMISDGLIPPALDSHLLASF